MEHHQSIRRWIAKRERSRTRGRKSLRERLKSDHTIVLGFTISLQCSHHISAMDWCTGQRQTTGKHTPIPHPFRTDSSGCAFTNWHWLLGWRATLHSISLHVTYPVGQLRIFWPAHWNICCKVIKAEVKFVWDSATDRRKSSYHTVPRDMHACIGQQDRDE